MRRHPFLTLVLTCALLAAVPLGAAPNPGVAAIQSQDLKEWLTYIASDELEGRAVYSTGIGLAAAYIEDHLHAWGARPAGDHGSYLQTVRVLGVKTTSRSTVTVRVAGTSRTFADGDGITFPKNAGGKRTFTVDRVEFAGYGLDAAASGHMDFRGKNVRNAAVVWLGAQGPRGVDATYRRLLTGRSRYATEQLGAAASIGPEPGGWTGGRGRKGRWTRRVVPAGRASQAPRVAGLRCLLLISRPCSVWIRLCLRMCRRAMHSLNFSSATARFPTRS